jgi:hypothetical protein
MLAKYNSAIIIFDNSIDFPNKFGLWHQNPVAGIDTINATVPVPSS